jgi:hypothetical protein
MNSNDFDRQGNLRSSVDFSFCGEICDANIRKNEKILPSGENKISFSVEIFDSYGFCASYWHPTLSEEKACRIVKNIPKGQTIFVGGKICIRKGKTYFNAKRFYFPDETPILIFAEEEEEKNI